MNRKSYPSDVSDAEWGFVAPYLTLMTLDAPQREHDLREVSDALRWLAHCGAPWRYLPGDFPPWAAVYQQTARWLKAGCFEAIVHDLRALLRRAQAEEGVEDPHGGGYPRPPVGAAGHARQRAGARPGGRTGAGRASGHREPCRGRLCGPGLHRSRGGASRPGTRDPTGSGETAR